MKERQEERKEADSRQRSSETSQLGGAGILAEIAAAGVREKFGKHERQKRRKDVSAATEWCQVDASVAGLRAMEVVRKNRNSGLGKATDARTKVHMEAKESHKDTLKNIKATKGKQKRIVT